MWFRCDLFCRWEENGHVPLFVIILVIFYKLFLLFRLEKELGKAEKENEAHQKEVTYFEMILLQWCFDIFNNNINIIYRGSPTRQGGFQ